MEECFTFQWGSLFFRWAGFIFKWSDTPWGDIGFDGGGGGWKKFVVWEGAPHAPHCGNPAPSPPHSKHQHSKFYSPPGTEDFNKSPQAEKKWLFQYGWLDIITSNLFSYPPFYPIITNLTEQCCIFNRIIYL